MTHCAFASLNGTQVRMFVFTGTREDVLLKARKELRSRGILYDRLVVPVKKLAQAS